MRKKSKILVIHGPNLNLLGQRDKDFYGELTLENINKLLMDKVKDRAQIEFFQSNHEGELIDNIQNTEADFIIINPGGLTHTSVSLRDSLEAKRIPFIEVHLSNIYSREPFRRKSLLSDVALGVVCGFREYSYLFALEYALRFLSEKDKNPS